MATVPQENRVELVESVSQFGRSTPATFTMLLAALVVVMGAGYIFWSVMDANQKRADLMTEKLLVLMEKQIECRQVDSRGGLPPDNSEPSQ